MSDGTVCQEKHFKHINGGRGEWEITQKWRWKKGPERGALMTLENDAPLYKKPKDVRSADRQRLSGMERREVMVKWPGARSATRSRSAEGLREKGPKRGEATGKMPGA